ncbi:MAG: hypothetical protein R3A10_02090 [Caldilineaceae bacterium]
MAALLEVRPRLQGDGHVIQCALEVVMRHLLDAAGRVVDVQHLVIVTLDDDVLAALEERDERRRHGQHLLDADVIVKFGLEPVLARGLDHIVGRRAVPGDAAGLAQLLEFNIAAVKAQNDGQRHRARLRRLHLHDGGRAPASLRLRRRIGRGLGCLLRLG